MKIELKASIDYRYKAENELRSLGEEVEKFK